MAEIEPIQIIGYADRLAVRPGETIAFKVSVESGADRYRAEIVRLICGDDRPDGPGFREQEIVPPSTASMPGGARRSIAAPTSWCPAMPPSTVRGASLWRRSSGRRCRAPASKPSWAAAAIALASTRVADLTLHLDGWQLAGQAPLHPRRWYRILASLDAGKAVIHYEALDRVLGDPAARPAAPSRRPAKDTPAGQPFLIGAHLGEHGRSAGHFNGKIEAPCLVAEALGPADLAAVLDRPRDFPLLTAWDFARDIETRSYGTSAPAACMAAPSTCRPAASRAHPGPAAASAGARPRRHYAAIHFHEDDLYDCGWETDFTWRIPAELRERHLCRAAPLRQTGEDHIPFFVLPPKGEAKAPVAFLAASATYLAYANSHDAYEDPTAERAHGALLTLSPTDLFLMARRDLGLSTYDVHRDGSGCFYSSRLRPILNMRPKRALWSFNADLHVTDWLEQLGEPYDVVDDENSRCRRRRSHRRISLPHHRDPSGILFAAYAGGAGGLHRGRGPADLSWRQRLLLEDRLAQGAAGSDRGPARGGRDPHLGGGAGGDLSLHLGRAGRPLARPRPAAAAPGRRGLCLGGFRFRRPYHRLPDSHDPRAAFIFEGVGEGPIGDFGAFGGAAALELDIVDSALGTPAHALRLAESRDHSNIYVLTPEELVTNYPGTDGIESPQVRADMVFFETPAGGAVFSTGSIGWAASLAHAGYSNEVARITANVLRRFIDPTSFAFRLKS